MLMRRSNSNLLHSKSMIWELITLFVVVAFALYLCAKGSVCVVMGVANYQYIYVTSIMVQPPHNYHQYNSALLHQLYNQYVRCACIQ